MKSIPAKNGDIQRNVILLCRRQFTKINLTRAESIVIEDAIARLYAQCIPELDNTVLALADEFESRKKVFEIRWNQEDLMDIIRGKACNYAN